MLRYLDHENVLNACSTIENEKLYLRITLMYQMSMNKLLEKKVLVIGAAVADITGFSAKPLIPYDSNPGRIVFSNGGVGRNIAENLARIGCQVDLISAFGDDVYGRTLKSHCQACGISISNSKTSLEHLTAIYLSINNPVGDMELALSDMDVVNEITPDFLASKASTIENAACIVVETNLSLETLNYISEKYAHKTLFIDLVSTTKAKKISPIIGRFHTIKPNLIEAEHLSGLIYKEFEDLKIMLQVFMDQGVKQVFISKGEEGCFYGNAQEYSTFPSKKSKIVNSSGAGDAFMAGLVFSYLNDFNIQETTTFASAMSQATLKSEEAVNPQLNLELVNRIKQDL